MGKNISFVVFHFYWLVMAVVACNVNFVNMYMIAYPVHDYTCTSLIHSPNPNLDCLIKYPLNGTTAMQ